jgi:cell division protein ZapA
MALVDVTINGRGYNLTCEAGQEEHLRTLAGHIDGRVCALRESVGQIGDARLLLMAAVLTMDEHLAATQRLEAQAKALVDLSQANEAMKTEFAEAERIAVEAVEAATKRVEDIVGRLAAA